MELTFWEMNIMLSMCVKVFIKVGLIGYAKFERGSLVHEVLEDCGLGIWGPYVVGSVDWGVMEEYGLWADHLRPNPMGWIKWVICYWFVAWQIIFKLGVDRSRFGKQLTYPISLSKAWTITISTISFWVWHWLILKF